VFNMIAQSAQSIATAAIDLEENTMTMHRAAFALKQLQRTLDYQKELQSQALARQLSCGNSALSTTSSFTTGRGKEQIKMEVEDAAVGQSSDHTAKQIAKARAVVSDALERLLEVMAGDGLTSLG
jgi:hypothetical protein